MLEAQFVRHLNQTLWGCTVQQHALWSAVVDDLPFTFHVTVLIAAKLHVCSNLEVWRQWTSGFYLSCMQLFVKCKNTIDGSFILWHLCLIFLHNLSIVLSWLTQMSCLYPLEYLVPPELQQKAAKRLREHPHPHPHHHPWFLDSLGTVKAYKHSAQSRWWSWADRGARGPIRMSGAVKPSLAQAKNIWHKTD